MDLRKLKYFIAAAEERSINRAAQRLHVSQPPLTRHIHALEEELGVQLFVRTAWGVELTRAGQYLLEQAREILARVEVTTRTIHQAEQGQFGQLEVGIFGSAMYNVIPEILDAFTVTHPEVQLLTHILPRGAQIEALHQGRILLGFDRGLPDSPGLEVELVYREPLVVALNSRNPLASQSHIHISDLRREPLIWDESPMAVAYITRLFGSHGIEPRFLLRTVDMMSAALMVASGAGTTLVAESLQKLNLPNVVFRPFEAGCDIRIDLHCAWRKQETSPLLSELLKTIRAWSAERVSHT